jgi:DNA replication protein DnaC
MNNVSTIEQLRTMRFSAMAKELELQMGYPATYTQLGFEERLGLLVDAEWNRRQANKLAKKIHDARLDIPSATMEGIEYHEDRKLDKKELLRYASCKYIDDEHHIVLKGATGCGKTYIACALGKAACRKYKTVRYIRMPELLDELAIARAEGNFKKTNKAYAKVDLLILDEWLIRCLSHQESYDLLEIIESRSKHGSTIFCTQYETDGWYARINAEPDQDSPIADAIMDRIINNSYIVSIEGRISMRERHGIKSDKDRKAGDPA